MIRRNTYTTPDFLDADIRKRLRWVQLYQETGNAGLVGAEGLTMRYGATRRQGKQTYLNYILLTGVRT